jgi:hypothetical protein
VQRIPHPNISGSFPEFGCISLRSLKQKSKHARPVATVGIEPTTLGILAVGITPTQKKKSKRIYIQNI